MCYRKMSIDEIKKALSTIIETTHHYPDKLHIGNKIFTVKKDIALKLFHQEAKADQFASDHAHEGFYITYHGFHAQAFDCIVRSPKTYLIPSNYTEPYTRTIIDALFTGRKFKKYNQPLPETFQTHIHHVIDTLDGKASANRKALSLKDITATVQFMRKTCLRDKKNHHILKNIQYLMQGFYNKSLEFIIDDYLEAAIVHDTNHNMRFDYSDQNITIEMLDQYLYHVELGGENKDSLSFYHTTPCHNKTLPKSEKKMIKDNIQSMVKKANKTLQPLYLENQNIIRHLSPSR